MRGGEFTQAARGLARQPGFSAAVALTLALGVAAATVVFAVGDTLFLRPLPYPRPERLVGVNEMDPRSPATPFGVSFPNFADFAGARSLEAVAAYQWTELELRGAGEPMRARGLAASPSLFQVLGVPTELGRPLADADDRPAHERPLLLGDTLWRARFGADPSVVGRSLELGGMPATVVGVLPPGFEYGAPTDFVVPLRTALDARALDGRSVHALACVARLRAGYDAPSAQAELDGILARTPAGQDADHRARVVALQDVLTADVRAGFRALAGACGFLLLIACANAANLLLARLPARSRELAIRAALGAGRPRLLRQMLAEALLAGAAGGGLGLMLAVLGLEALRGLLPDPRLAAAALDARVAGFAVGLTLLTALVCGSAPAWAAGRLDILAALRFGPGVSGLGRAPRRLRRLMVAGEIGVSFALLAGAGLMLGSLARVLEVDPGFRAERLLTLRVSLPAVRYDEPGQVRAAFQAARRRLEALPGIERVSAVSRLPISGGESSGELTVEGQPLPAAERPAASFRRVLPGYFATLGIPLVEGRDFDDRDRGEQPFVVIVNRSLAERAWPAGGAVGRRIKVGPAESEPWLTVVGVAADVRHAGLESEPGFATFEPVAQRPASSLRFTLRTKGRPEAALASVRAALRAFEPELVLDQEETMQARLDRSLRPRRLQTGLLALFAVGAVALAGVGLFGVVAYSVSRRTREIGVRIALGAARRDVVALVVREGVALAGAGVGVGCAGALALTRLLESLLFGVRPGDPATLAAATAAMLLVTLAACAVPARRAARIEPADALHQE